MNPSPPFKKRLLRSVGDSFAFHNFARAVEIADRGRKYLRVLTYHRIDWLDRRFDLDPSLISATPDQFARQLDWLMQHFSVVSLEAVLDSMGGETSLPARAVLITFDDAYEDFYLHAFDILRDRGLPASLFVPTAYPDQPDRRFWWDRLYEALLCDHAGSHLETKLGSFDVSNEISRGQTLRELKKSLKQLPWTELNDVVDSICMQSKAKPLVPAVMSWDQLNEVSDQHVTLVPHTHTHPLLDRISPSEVRNEVELSMQMLKQKTGCSLPAIAYPSGQYSRQVVEQSRKAGCELGFTTNRGINRITHCDPMQLCRINVGRETPDNVIRFQLNPASRPMQWLLR